MLRLLSLPLLALFLTTLPAVAQTTDPGTSKPAPATQDSAASSDAKKPKKVWTNEDISKSTNGVSVVGDAKEKDRDKSKPVAPRTANAQYVLSIRKQLEKLQKQLEDVDKQITDLKNFNAGEPSTTASGIELDKRYQREPIEVQIRALQNKKKDLQSKIDALYDEARKKGVEPGELR
jgi:chaperonin cofactor prefoldin